MGTIGSAFGSFNVKLKAGNNTKDTGYFLGQVEQVVGQEYRVRVPVRIKLDIYQVGVCEARCGSDTHYGFKRHAQFVRVAFDGLDNFE
jgi:hypothetical protein